MDGLIFPIFDRDETSIISNRSLAGEIRQVREVRGTKEQVVMLAKDCAYTWIALFSARQDNHEMRSFFLLCLDG